MHKEFHIEIDKLTNSIEEVSSGESFDTEVAEVSKREINTVHKKGGWFFNWKLEFKQHGRKIYKLTIKGESDIQALVSIELVPAQHYIEMHLI